MDKKPVPFELGTSTTKNNNNNQAESSSRLQSSPIRTSKRKAKQNLLNFISSDSSQDDNDFDKEATLKKKRKFQLKQCIEKVTKNEIVKSKIKSDYDIEETESPTFDQDTSFEFNNADFYPLKASNKTKIVNIDDENKQQQEYPKRRVVPPNPGKKNSSKSSKSKKTSLFENKKINDQLSDEAISQVLNNLDEEIDDNHNGTAVVVDDIETIDEETNVEIKPLPISKPTSKKIQAAQSKLKNAQDDEERKKKIEEDSKRKKKAAEEKKRRELITKRTQQIEEEKKTKEMKEKQQQKQNEFYGNLFKDKTKFAKGNLKKSEKKNKEQREEESLLVIFFFY